LGLLERGAVRHFIGAFIGVFGQAIEARFDEIIQGGARGLGDIDVDPAFARVGHRRGRADLAFDGDAQMIIGIGEGEIDPLAQTAFFEAVAIVEKDPFARLFDAVGLGRGEVT
jgi:hypothetical protein